MFCTMLKYKAEWQGKTYIECEHCKTIHDRDINAAINIRDESLRILSLGTSDTAYRGDVRPKSGRKSVLRQSPVK